MTDHLVNVGWGFAFNKRAERKRLADAERTVQRWLGAGGEQEGSVAGTEAMDDARTDNLTLCLKALGMGLAELSIEEDRRKRLFHFCEKALKEAGENDRPPSSGTNDYTSTQINDHPESQEGRWENSSKPDSRKPGTVSSAFPVGNQ